jgi:hypothetical protein
MRGKRTDPNEAGRQEFLLRLDKWSTVVIGAIVGGALGHSGAEAGWLNRRDGWINRYGPGGGLDAR